MLQAPETQKTLDAPGEENGTTCTDGFLGEIRRTKAVCFAKAAVNPDILLSGGRYIYEKRQE